MAADFPKPTRQPQTTTIYDDDWDGLPYKPNPRCSICRGAGFVYPREGDRIAYHRAIPCAGPGCLLDSIRGKQPNLQRQTFETFQPVRGAEKALKAAQALAYGTAQFVWLLIYGQPGNGKTHLCNAIATETRARGCEVKLVLAADLFAMLREAIQTHQADNLLRRFKDVFFLAIDDYGVEYGSEWEMAKFDELMTSRYATAKPTVLVTNKELTELPERIQSRFTDKMMARAVHNSAADFRSQGVHAY